GWFSSSEWRLRPLECAHGWSPRGVVQTDRAVARQASKRFSIGDSPWHECCNRLAQLRQKSPKAGIVRGGLVIFGFSGPASEGCDHRTGASPGSPRFASRKKCATWTTGICAKLAL